MPSNNEDQPQEAKVWYEDRLDFFADEASRGHVEKSYVKKIVETYIAESHRRGRLEMAEEMRDVLPKEWAVYEQGTPGLGIHAIVNKINEIITHLKNESK